MSIKTTEDSLRVGGGTRFKKGNKLGKGRPKLMVNTINEQLKKEGYEPIKPDHIMEAYGLILQLPFERIKEFASKDSPNKEAILYKVLANGLLNKDKHNINLENYINRLIGKAQQKVDVTGSVFKLIYEESNE